MQKTILRVTAAALMAASAAVLTVAWQGGAAARPADVPQAEAKAEPVLPSAAKTREAPVMCVQAALMAVDVPPGTVITIYDAESVPVQTLTLGKNGAVTDPLSPGGYVLVWDDGRYAGRFMLGENGAVSEGEGNVWTDGEIIWLDMGTTCALTVTVEKQSDGAVPLCLEGEEYTASVYTDALTWLEEGGCALHATFFGVPAGTYRLWEVGGASCEVTVPPETTTLAVTLPEA